MDCFRPWKISKNTTISGKSITPDLNNRRTVLNERIRDYLR